MGKKKAKKAGRPPLPEEERLGSFIKIRLTEEQRLYVEEAATLASKKVGVFARDAVLDRARRVLGE